MQTKPSIFYAWCEFFANCGETNVSRLSLFKRFSHIFHFQIFVGGKILCLNYSKFRKTKKFNHLKTWTQNNINRLDIELPIPAYFMAILQVSSCKLRQIKQKSYQKISFSFLSSLYRKVSWGKRRKFTTDSFFCILKLIFPIKIFRIFYWDLKFKKGHDLFLFLALLSFKKRVICFSFQICNWMMLF